VPAALLNLERPAGAWRRTSAAGRCRHRGQAARGRGACGQMAWGTRIDDRSRTAAFAPAQYAILVPAEAGVRRMADYRLHAPTSIAPRFDGSHQVVLSRRSKSSSKYPDGRRDRNSLYSAYSAQLTKNRRTVLRTKLLCIRSRARTGAHSTGHNSPTLIFAMSFPPRAAV
jgi:hypothetical protein